LDEKRIKRKENQHVLRFNERKPKGRKPPRNYFSRREQYRLMGLVFALGFVVLVAVRAFDPTNWYWLAPPNEAGGGKSQQAQAKPAAVENGTQNIDTRHRPTPVSPMPLDTVRLGREDGAADEKEPGYFPGVVSGHLREIKDNQPFRPSEAAAWYNLLSVLRDAKPAELEGRASQVGFVQLYQQPEAYRGRLVTFKGLIRRVTWREVGKNKEGIASYYELVLKPQAGPPRPVMAYVLQLPEELKSKGEDINEPIQLTGFFFKNWVYAGKHATYVAPVLLARDVRWSPPVVEPAYAPPWGLVAAVGLVSALAAAAIAWLAYHVSQQKTMAGPPPSPAEVQASVALMEQFDSPQNPAADHSIHPRPAI
jgi:hypothetical protein